MNKEVGGGAGKTCEWWLCQAGWGWVQLPLLPALAVLDIGTTSTCSVLRP